MDFEGYVEGVSYGSYKFGMMFVILLVMVELVSFY